MYNKIVPKKAIVDVPTNAPRKAMTKTSMYCDISFLLRIRNLGDISNASFSNTTSDYEKCNEAHEHTYIFEVL